MMDPFLAQMIARKEHELMIQSIAPVSEEEGYVRNERPGMIRRSVGNLLKLVGHALASPGTRKRQTMDVSCKAPLSDNG